MTTVTVFRHAPPPIIGVCGVVPDRVDGIIVSSGVHPTRTQLARVVGQHRSQTELAAAR